MWKKEAKHNLAVLLRVGLPYTVIGVIVVFLGLYLIKHFLADSEYLTAFLFLWLALFWFIYQPLFRRKIRETAERLKRGA